MDAAADGSASRLAGKKKLKKEKRRDHFLIGERSLSSAVLDDFISECVVSIGQSI